MANLEVGVSSVTINYEALEISEHQRPSKFFKPTAPLMAYPDSTPNRPYATPYPNGSSNADSTFTAEKKPHNDNGLDPWGGMDEQEWRKARKRLKNREAARKSKIRKKRELEELQSRVKAISLETSMLSRNITRYSEEIEVLKTENNSIMEELRNVCDQETISRLESMNPENSSQEPQASYESDRNIDASPSLETYSPKPENELRKRKLCLLIPETRI